jgi:hypothetical protein
MSRILFQDPAASPTGSPFDAAPIRFLIFLSS